MAKHEPAAGGSAGRAVVVNDNAVAAANAELLHRQAERGGDWEHVRRGTGAVTDLIDVEETRAGDVASQILFAATAPGCGHEPARVHNNEIGLAEMLRQPIRGNERFHLRNIG